jgi:hypothetical protein
MTAAGGLHAAESLSSAMDRVHRALVGGRRTPLADGTAERSLPDQESWHPLEHLRTLFGLSAFERDVLALCAGFNLESRFSHALAASEAGITNATFGMAFTVLDEPHWSAVTPAGPLRYWQLVEVGPGNLLDAALRLDERILQFLVGVPAFDERLQTLIRPIPVALADGPARGDVVDAGAGHWSRLPPAREPLLLIGRQRSAQQSAFVQICRRLGLGPYRLDAGDIPTDPAERELLARLWTREATLAGAALDVGTEHCESIRNLSAWLELVTTPVAIEVPPGSCAEQFDGRRLHLGALSAGERKALWSRDLGPLAQRMNGDLDRIAEYFDFDQPAIALSAAQVRELADTTDQIGAGELCWRVCREHGRRSLDALADRVQARAGWSDLILPPEQIVTLRQIAIHMRQRAVVNDQWGFAFKHPGGLGLSALFGGTSGTGKTMAAAILAVELNLDLYKVDLASVVSKYIGETEKNLQAIFDGAERSGAILLFDEADALFGRRSEVRDSHDRYANLEISYLLQKMEAYRGVAILTTNMQHALDPAFMRRIRFIVPFPFPDAGARARIWQRIFPAQTPVADLDFDQLGQLNVSGGVIRNIALHAAFLAADDSGLVEPRHILAAARTEYAKMDRPLTAAETRGQW